MTERLKMDDLIRRKSILNIIKRWQNKLKEQYGENDEYVKCLDSVIEHIESVKSTESRVEMNAVTEKDVEIQELRRQRDLLLQENAELREKQRWIPVGEKLPENEPDNKDKKVIKCLVFVESPFPHGKGTVQFRQREIVYDLNGIPEGWKWSKVGSLRVTHWMPLPEAPEVGER